jgi:hypothetical protein
MRPHIFWGRWRGGYLRIGSVSTPNPIVWLETFVDPERGFKGTCYKAANWNCLGLTTGRGKNDNSRKPNRSFKYIFGYPLKKDFKKALYGIL